MCELRRFQNERCNDKNFYLKFTRHLKNCKDRLVRMDSTRLTQLAFRYRHKNDELQKTDLDEKTTTPGTLNEKFSKSKPWLCYGSI